MEEVLKQQPFNLIIQVIIASSVLALFLSVFIDFMLFSQDNNVKKERKSIVETGTMTLFFIAYYLILVSKVGTIGLTSQLAKQLMMVLGTIMILTGCAANIKGRFNLGKNWANQIKIYKEHTLVQTGMYSIVRHPLYSSIIFMFYGGCLVYRNIAAFTAVSFVFIPFMYYRAKQEETLLLQSFPKYEEYKKTTGMLFPRIRKRKDDIK
ncbi:MAG: isoprenylcysteine carboxyl methyltransferase [Clostridia bacterium]|jgi:protein-S-isoprenylcysteine O-methyltransferase Ste14|nr:isoprenylcysteine carboxyl methyltransferase [Clostridia bacterium]